MDLVRLRVPQRNGHVEGSLVVAFLLQTPESLSRLETINDVSGHVALEFGDGPDCILVRERCLLVVRDEALLTTVPSEVVPLTFLRHPLGFLKAESASSVADTF